MSSPATPPAADSNATATPAAPSVRLAVGLSWLDRYELQASAGDFGGGPCFTGLRAPDGAEVNLRQLLPAADSPARQEVWRRLAEKPITYHPELLETVPMETGRVEVWQSHTGLSLQEWLSQQKLSADDVLVVVRALARALLSLHQRDLVYLRLSLENVRFAGDGLDSAILAHLELCALIGQENKVPLPVDARSFPPEGLDQTELAVTKHLKAWDWWTLGRLAQELVLGKPVAALLAPRQAQRDSAELRAAAETLLRETHLEERRAGALELMPELPPALALFLRGVLTTAREARWGDTDVQAWLDGKKPREHYQRAETTLLLEFAGTSLTLPEIAEHFGRADHWTEGVEQFKADEPAPGSVVDALLNQPNDLSDERDWFIKVREMREVTAFRHLAVAVRTEVLAAVAWLGVAPKGTRLRWRGRPVDAEFLRELVQDESGLALARALCTRAYADLVQQKDSTTAWGLRAWGHEWEEAETLAAKNRWLRRLDSRRLLASYIFRGGEHRTQALKRGREKYHLTWIEPLQALFAAEHLSPAQMAVVGYTLERAEEFQYITHLQWLWIEQTRLRRRAESLVTAVQRLRAARAMAAAAPLCGGTLAWWTSVAALLFAAAIYWPGIAGTASCIGVVAVGALIRWQLAGVIRPLSPSEGEARWRWSGVTTRLRAAAQAAAEAAARPTIVGLRKEFTQVNKELTALELTPKPEAVPLPRAGFGLWIIATLGWCGLLGLIALIGWRGSLAPWSPEKVISSWRTDFTWINDTWQSATSEEAFELPTKAGKPVWPYVSSGVTHPVVILDRVTADERQMIVMKRFMLMLSEHYDRKSLHGLIAVEVPLADGIPGGVMILDVGTGKLASATVYRLEQLPVRGMTIDLDGIKAMFLDGL